MVNSSFQWLLVSVFSILHPLYVSVIEMNHNSKDKAVEISVRIFTDDFEATLKKYTKEKVDLTKSTQKVLMDKLINSYISNKLQLNIDGKNVSLHYIGYELQKESVWCYFEVTNISSVKKVNIFCNLLYDYQEKQMNIFHIKANNSEKSYKLDNPKTNAVIEF